MSSELKREYLEILRARYQASDRPGRSQIINEFCANTGMHRKSAIRCLRGKKKEKNRAGRKKIYTDSTVKYLRQIWILSDQMCSKNLAQAMPDWVNRLLIPVECKQQLLQMSPACMDRKLKPYRAVYRRGQRAGTKPGKLLKHIIPIKTLSNIPTCAGFVEADTVAHCGGTLMGEFIWSLTFTDTFTGWTENRAVWGKHAKNVHEAISDIEDNLPFEIQLFNCDNGSEFLNHRLVEYFQPGGPRNRSRFVMTRSRSYHSNDNAHVEQKNWTHVRQLFGYERFEFKELIPLMNELYLVQNLLTNFFHPQMKLKSKVRIGAKIKKTYDVPKTPYRRLLSDSSLSQNTKEALTTLFNSLNPFDLRQQREEYLANFFKLKKKLQSAKMSPESSQLEPALSGNTF